MTSLRALIALLAVACTLVAAAGAESAGAASDDNYVPYAVARQTMMGCSLDRTWHHFGSVKRRTCARMRKLYILWADPGESSDFYLHCRTAKCPATPIGDPDARAPIPRGAHVFR
jgi:hypothetical protein